MGLRGYGSTRAKEAREQADKLNRELPWKAKGLSRYERVVAFLEFLPVTKGRLEGSRFTLLDKQKRFLKRVYGRTGANRTRLAIKSEPKGNGKTGLLAGLALCHLAGPEAEPRGEVYSASIDRDMAALIFKEMEAIVNAVPELLSRINIVRFHKKLEVLEGDGAGSTYEALSSDARTAHGRAPTFWVFDEFAQARDGELLDNIKRNAGKRKATLGMVISTQAATDDHPLSILIDDALAGHDPTVVIDFESAPMDADPFALETIMDCNPAAGIFLDVEDIKREAAEAQRHPIYEARYRNLRLNQRIDTNAENRIVPAVVWKSCEWEIDVADLKGRRCYGGLDLSGKHDLTALVLAFPDDDPEPSFDLISYFWTPEGQIALRRDTEQQTFRAWIKQGHITALPGKVIRYRHMAHALAKIKRDFDLVMVGYDRWRIDDFTADMAEEGVDVPLEPFGQGYKDMGPAVEYFVELALSARLRHDGNPALNAAVSSAILSTDPAGNQKVEKEKSNSRSVVRVDGLVAALMAVGTAKRHMGRPPEKKTSIYSRPELWPEESAHA